MIVKRSTYDGMQGRDRWIYIGDKKLAKQSNVLLVKVGFGHSVGMKGSFIVHRYYNP